MMIDDWWNSYTNTVKKSALQADFNFLFKKPGMIAT